jgi:hypothetical protein
MGWRKNVETPVPFSLVVSFEAISFEVNLYNQFVHVQQQLDVQQAVQVG